MREGIYDYLKFLLDNFFKWWWAVVSGVASIASWIFISNNGIILSRKLSGFLVLFLSALIFLVISIFYRGWTLYCKSSNIKVRSFQKNSYYDSEYICIFECLPEYPTGTLLELHRFIDGVQVLIAVVEIIEKNSKGQYQAKAIWTVPVHLKDLKSGIFSYNDIEAKPIITSRVLEDIIDDRIRYRGV